MTNILTPAEQRAQMKLRLLNEIDAIEKALVDYRASIMLDPNSWSNSAEYLNVLDAFYDLMEIDGVTEKAIEIAAENDREAAKLERERWEDEADYRYEEWRDRQMEGGQ